VGTLTEEQLFHVTRSEISWRYWKAYKKIREFNYLQYYSSAKELYNDMKSVGIVRAHEGGDEGLLAEKPVFFYSPGRWSPARSPEFPPGMFC
jgi:hypothetical protein